MEVYDQLIDEIDKIVDQSSYENQNHSFSMPDRSILDATVQKV